MSAAEETEEGTGAGAPARVRLQVSPSGIDVKVPGGVTVFDAASWNGIAIDSTCGGHGTCRKCKVQITEGEAPLSKLDSRAFTPDELRAGWRLACRIQTAADLSIEVPPLQTRPKAATVGVGRQVILRPSIVKRFLQLEEATLSDQRTDIQRVLDAMDDLELTTSISVLRTLGKVLRSSNWEVTAVIADSELIAVYLADKLKHGFSLKDALKTSIEDLDGTFSFLVSTKDEIGYAKDKLAAKPMVKYEDDKIIAIASEEVSLNRLFPGRALNTSEPAPGTYDTWQRSISA